MQIKEEILEAKAEGVEVSVETEAARAAVIEAVQVKRAVQAAIEAIALQVREAVQAVIEIAQEQETKNFSFSTKPEITFGLPPSLLLTTSVKTQKTL